MSLAVIPGAPLSFGMSTRAAYGGVGNPTVYRVQNLNDSGANSFRAALAQTGPRVIIFETSGTIPLASDLYVSDPYVTIAGQTAPSPGITLKNYGLRVETAHVHAQHFRVRPGGLTCNNCIQVFNVAGAHDIVFDHISASWGQDENWVMQNPSADLNITVWRCITSESLQLPPVSGCSGGTANSHGMLLYAGAKNVAVIQTLFASNVERNPYMQNDTKSVLLNNLIYQWSGAWAFFYGNHRDLPGGPWFSTVAGNRNIVGPSTADASNPAWHFFFYSDVETPGNQLYRLDNTVDDPNGYVVERLSQLSYNPDVGSPPSETPLPVGYSPLASTAVEAWVLARAGCRPADRDAVDARVVAEVRARTGGFPSSESQVGGWPTLAVNTRALTLPANPHVVTPSGYTNLELWLHAYAAGVEGVAAVPSAPTGLRIVA